MVSTKFRVITYGIIDYIVKFTLEKEMEYKYKKMVGTDDPTILNPYKYKNRFRENISKKFFLDIDD